MFVEYAVQVNAIEQHRGAQAYRSQIRPEVQLERPALYTQVRHGLLGIESPLIQGGASELGSVRSCRRCSSRGAKRDLDVSPGRFRVLHPARLAGCPDRATRRAGISRPNPRSKPRHRSTARAFGGAIDNCFDYTSYHDDITGPVSPPTFAEVPTTLPSSRPSGDAEVGEHAPFA